MKRVRVSRLAEKDLDEIWYQIAKRSGSIEIADGVVDSITEFFPLFATAPEAGSSRDWLEPGLRGLPVGKYIIYYRKIGQYLVISRVIHAMRDQNSAYCPDPY